MNKVFEILIKGILAVIWFVATVITTIILSPFIFYGWLSGMLTKQKKDNDITE